MSGISTHILDLALGRPASGVTVRLESEENGMWNELSRGETDADGRIRSALPPAATLRIGQYRFGYETGAYFRSLGSNCFHPYIQITFEVGDAAQNYHVPLLISPYSYSTYRGS